MAIDFFNVLIQHSDVSGTKSHILKPITWVMGIIIGALVYLAPKPSTPSYILIGLGVLLILAFFLGGYTYFYCLRENPDALRSESYVISKMAIERGLVGDSSLGRLISNKNASQKQDLEITGTEEAQQHE